MKIDRRLPVAGVVALAFGVLVPTAAFGHADNVAGVMVVTGNRGGSSTTVGAGTSVYCAGSPSGTAQASANGGSVTVTVSASTQPGCTTSLPSGTYSLFFENDAFALDANGNWSGVEFCDGHFPSPLAPDRGTLLGTMKVKGGGTGQGTFALPSGLTPNASGRAGGVCMTDMAPENSSQTFENVAVLTIVA
ncbi:MAG TPA: hypothetical protein VFJ85_17460 [Acidimicrobiales bacterium]|nr:hypothetical protein [Acidimicrobiales bacterium]